LTRLVVLIDGHCVLCNRYALWVSRCDHADRVRFYAIQSTVAQRWLQAHGLPCGVSPDTVYLIHGREIFKKSAAFFALVAELEGPVRWLRLLRWTRALGADVVYDFVAHRRYRWFGNQTEACSLLHAAQLGHRILRDDEAARFFAELDEVRLQGEGSTRVG
jgi:predicted DCC family thiol-disulfide oxidoreductase YuxK